VCGKIHINEVSGIQNIFCLADSLGKIDAHYELIIRFDNLNKNENLEIGLQMEHL